MGKPETDIKPAPNLGVPEERVALPGSPTLLHALCLYSMTLNLPYHHSLSQDEGYMSAYVKETNYERETGHQWLKQWSKHIRPPKK